MAERLLVKMIFGSHLYGTDTPASDRDWKGVFVPSRRDILLQQAPRSRSLHTRPADVAKNTANDVDDELYSLHYYVELLLEGQTAALDMLFTPPSEWMNRSSTWRDEIAAKSHLFLSRKATAFAGYCRTQAAKYGIKGSRVAAVRDTIETLAVCDQAARLIDTESWIRAASGGKEYVSVLMLPERKNGPVVPFLEVCGRKFAFTLKVAYVKAQLEKILGEYGKRALAAEHNEGIDWKALSHAVRVCDEAVQLLHMHTIGFPLARAELLRDIKLGKFPYKEVAEMIEKGLAAVEEASTVSTLPDEPDRAAAEEIVAHIYETEAT